MSSSTQRASWLSFVVGQPTPSPQMSMHVRSVQIADGVLVHSMEPRSSVLSMLSKPEVLLRKKKAIHKAGSTAQRYMHLPSAAKLVARSV